MKIAIISDDLIQHGGQERMLEALLDLYPHAHLYASIISETWKEHLTKRKVSFTTSKLELLPFSVKLSRYYAPFLVHNIAYESFNLNDYDLVISNTSRFSHNVITKPTTIHISYMHSPGRMFWMTNEYFKAESYGFLKPFKKLGRSFLFPFLAYERMLDYTSAQRIDAFIANSEEIKKRISKYYKRDSVVVYPFIDVSKLSTTKHTSEDYFLIVTRLVAWKRVDLAINACLKNNLKLKIVGDGSDRARLEKIADKSPLIEFLGAAPDSDKIPVLQKCKALIQTQHEDFGIVPIEANAAGKIVLAYGRGGVLETMVKGVTAEYFNEQTVDSLEKLLISFDPAKYDINECTKNAARFDRSVFNKNMLNYINSVVGVY